MRQFLKIKFILFFVIFLEIQNSNAQQIESNKIDFFLCIGQSNMAGRGVLAISDSITTTQLLLFNAKNKWEIAKNPMNKYSNIRKSIRIQQMSPSWSFGKKLTSYFKKVGLVVNARGGTKIEQWHNDSILYKKTISRTKKAQIIGNIKGVIWHQGEGNRKNWKTYSNKLINLIKNIRKDLNKNDLPFIVGEIGNWRITTKQNSDSINNVLRNIKNKINNVDYVSVSDLSHKGDSVHFDRSSQLVLGERYALKYLEMNLDN